MSSDEASYFLNMAVIGGTLLALSFVTLQFFLENLLNRYESVAFPVFRSRDFTSDRRPSTHLAFPDFLKDKELFDGDPLIIFMAFSVGVTWIQFLVPLTIGLTAAWLGSSLLVLAGELAFLLIAFAISFVHRNRAIKRLKPYLRGEEYWWPALGGILLALYFLAVGVALISALRPVIRIPAFLTIWDRWGIPNEHASLFALKVVCILSLLIGTYTTNKDMFIFFKSIGAEGMRRRWLELFRERFKDLEYREQKVEATLSGEPKHMLQEKWNNGCPRNMTSTHDAYRAAGEISLKQMWREFIDGRRYNSVWLLDVPHIADWEAEVEGLLKYGGALTPAGATETKKA
jgi:hypothetical protein